VLQSWQVHVEFGRRELLRAPAILVQEARPARILAEIVDERLDDDFGQSVVVVYHRLVQPLERAASQSDLRRGYWASLASDCQAPWAAPGNGP
jgi:hypothetical protein